MKKRRVSALWLYAAALSLPLLITGCGQSEKEKIFAQAEKDLEAGSYAYALSGYEASIANRTNLALSWRGSGIAHLRMGETEAAISDFTMALSEPNINQAQKKDILSYRVTARLKAGQYEEALEDCRQLSAMAENDADVCFLQGETLLAMDIYDEAATNFEKSFQADRTYERAVQIYEAYVARNMEADGTRYLEMALSGDVQDADDHSARGRVYYYMDDYNQAASELIQAQNEGDHEAILLLGKVYLEQKDYSNARGMFSRYNDTEGTGGSGWNGLALCDLGENNFASALSNIQQGITAADPDELQSLLYNEIVIYEKMLDFATARQKAEEYLQTFPEDTTMQRELTFLRTRT